MSLNIEKLREILVSKDIKIDKGITDEEFEKIEKFYSIKFPQICDFYINHFCQNFTIGVIFQKKMYQK